MSDKVTIGLDYSHNNKLTLEASSYSEFTQFLFSSGYKLGKIQAGFDSLKKLEVYDMILFSTPNNKRIPEDEIEILEQYVKNGGNLLIISSSGGDHTNNTNLNELTSKFGFEFVEDEVNDSMNYINLQKRPLLTKFHPHLVTEQIKKVVFSSSCSLNILDFIEDEENIKIEVLVNAGLNCWRKLYNFSNDSWEDEDSPKLPLMVGVEYYKGKVIGFGNLSMFSSLGREYGFSAFDNDVLIANIFRWLTMGTMSDGKAITINLNMDLYYWVDSIMGDQGWEDMSDIVNLSLKYFKDNYSKIIDEIKKMQAEKVKKKEVYDKNQKDSKARASEDKILEVIVDRKKDDLMDIMSALEEVSGEKYELEIDFDEDKSQEEKEPEEVEEEDEQTIELKKEILDKETDELEKELISAIDEEEKAIKEGAKEEIEKEFDKKLKGDEAQKIEKALDESIGKDIKRIKDSILKKAKTKIVKESKKIIKSAKDSIMEKGDDEEAKEEIIQRAREEMESERKKILDTVQREMDAKREKSIQLIKENEIKIIKENQEFLDDILEATDLFEMPDLDGDKDPDFSEEDKAKYEEETSKSAIWHGKPTKAFKDWLREKN